MVEEARRRCSRRRRCSGNGSGSSRSREPSRRLASPLSWPALGVLLQVNVLLVGAAIVGGVFLVTLLALILARRDDCCCPHSSSPARASPTRSFSPTCSRSRRRRWPSPRSSPSRPCFPTSTGARCAGWSSGASCRRSRSPRSRARHPSPTSSRTRRSRSSRSPALPAVTILTALLLLQFSERIRRAREDETAAHVEAEQTRRALERTSQRLHIALSAAGIGIWDLDPRTGMLSLDHRCASIFGLAAGGPLDYAGFLSLIVADDQPRVGAAIHRAVHGDGAARHELEFRIRDASGAAERWLRCTAQLLVDGRQVVGLIGTAQDLTSAKRTEAELRSAKEQAEDANHAKDEFLAMLGHELRNPLAPMLTALELLRVRLGEAGARERDVIQRQVRNLAQLVDDVLDVAHIRKGRMTIDSNSIYVRQIVAKGLELVTPMLEERRHRLEVDIQPPSLVVVGDERRLIQAVTNLLTNAVKYTDPGGAIRVSVANEGADTVLRVADTGVGISAALLPRVFDLFVQGERTPDRREGGLGLGLPIVRSIVERHGGTVSAFSDGVGRGTEFVIRLPSADAHTPMPVASAVVASDRVAASTPKVLIVDDNRDAADSLHALLRDHGFACASALDGPSGTGNGRDLRARRRSPRHRATRPGRLRGRAPNSLPAAGRQVPARRGDGLRRGTRSGTIGASGVRRPPGQAGRLRSAPRDHSRDAPCPRTGRRRQGRATRGGRHAPARRAERCATRFGTGARARAFTVTRQDWDRRRATPSAGPGPRRPRSPRRRRTFRTAG